MVGSSPTAVSVPARGGPGVSTDPQETLVHDLRDHRIRRTRGDTRRRRARLGRHPFGVRALAQLAAEREQSVGAISPKAKADDDGGDDGNEADEIAEGADQYAEARTSPGIVAPGAYGAAWTSLTNLPTTGGSWRNITNLPYNSDDPRYRDYDSNSSGGSGNVTGRMAAMAADDDGYVYAGSAGGGVWRSRTGGGRWQPISDKLPSQSTGALALDGAGRLWLGTGEATTNADAYLGSGVYVLSDPGTARSPPAAGSAATNWNPPPSTNCASAAARCGRRPARACGATPPRGSAAPGSWSSHPTRPICRAVHSRTTTQPRTRTSPTTSRSTRRTPPRWSSRSAGAAVTTTTASTPR